uniref:Uncharacterized protein n=1 Tax=Zea mays TaxID=4577 RepID=A0A804LXN2_MAIZE
MAEGFLLRRLPITAWPRQRQQRVASKSPSLPRHRPKPRPKPTQTFHRRRFGSCLKTMPANNSLSNRLPHRLLLWLRLSRTDGILGAKDQRTVTSKARPRLLLQGDVQSLLRYIEAMCSGCQISCR